MVRYETETIGARLRRLRKDKALSQRAISGPGVSAAYVCRIEKDERVPSIRAIRVMAQRLGVSPEYLETGMELPDAEGRDLRLSEAELELRLGEDVAASGRRFKALLAEAGKAGDENAATRAQIGLGLVAEERGEHEEAIRLLQAAVESAFVTPLNYPQAFTALGHAYVVVDQGQKAVELFRDCLKRLGGAGSDPTDRTAYIRFATYLSYALSDLGDLAGAREAIADALGKTDEDMDPYTQVRLYWSQARLAAAAGEFGAAKRNIGRAIALLETTEDSMHLGRAHLMKAEILLASGENEQAGPHLEQAEELLGERADAQERALFLVEKSRFEARSGRAEAAAEHAREAIELAGDEDSAARGRALWALAEALAAEGKTDQALTAIDEAEELLRGETRYGAEVLRARATMLEQAGRVDEALVTLKQVADLLQG